jgi:NitT/TauT family transport system ATP-binding protein
MKQRVAIARALATQPKILLMDEPFGALDIQSKETMQQFLRQLWQKTGCTILMITHDVEESVFLSQRIYVLSTRPGQIQDEFIINLPEERNYKIKRQLEFQKYVGDIMDLLRGSKEESVMAGNTGTSPPSPPCTRG